MARQLYEYWFVQFEFPDENGRPYKSSGGKMVWSDELNQEIPFSWEVVRVRDKLKVFTGKKDVSKAKPGPYPFYSCAATPQTSDEFIFDGKAIIISGNGAYTGRVNFADGKFDLYQRTYACVAREIPSNIAFYYNSFKCLFEPIMYLKLRGSTIPYIVLSDIDNFCFCFNQEYVDYYSKIALNILDLSVNLQKQNMFLIEQRNYLIRSLMNNTIAFTTSN